MTSAPARALRLVAAAFALSALPLVVQTVVLRALGYESPFFDRALVALGVVFLAADVVLLVALTRLARSVELLGGFLVPARVCVAFTLAGDLHGILTRGTSGEDASTAIVASTATPEVSAGAALLVLLALVTVSRDVRARTLRTPHAVTLASVAAGVAIFAPTLFRFWRAALREPTTTSTSVAWISFALEVAQPAALAVFAYLVARAASAEGPRVARSPGPYRAPDAATQTPSANVRGSALDLSDGRAVREWRGVVSGLGRYRLAIVVRVVVGIVTFCFTVFILAARLEELSLALILITLSDIVFALVQVVAIVAMFRLPSSKGLLIGAIVALGLYILCSGAGLLTTLAGFSRRYSVATRDYGEHFPFGTPFGILMSVISMALVASALGRTAGQLADTAVIAQTRWIQGLTAFGATLFVSVLFAGSAASTGSGAAGMVILAGLTFLAAAAWTAVVSIHIPLVGRIHKTMAAMLSAPSA